MKLTQRHFVPRTGIDSRGLSVFRFGNVSHHSVTLYCAVLVALLLNLGYNRVV